MKSAAVFLSIFVSGLGSFGGVMHVLGNGWVRFESVVSETKQELVDTTTAAIAESAGYKKPTLAKREVRQLVIDEANRQGISPALALANMVTESSEDAHNVSPVGALGLMQVMPFNATPVCGISAKELLDEKKNITCGVKILKAALVANKMDLDKALREYNGGRKCVVNNCEESVKHSAKVRLAMSKMKVAVY